MEEGALVQKELLFPGYFFPDVFAIPYEDLIKGLGIRAICFDLDNTLLEHGEDEEFSLTVMLLLLRLQDLVDEVWIGSNDPTDRSCLLLGYEEKMFFFNTDSYLDLLTGGGKPNPEFFLKMAARRGIAPEQVLVVGDCFVRDAVGALCAGMHAVTVNRQHEDPLFDKILMLRYFESLILRDFGILRIGGQTVAFIEEIASAANGTSVMLEDRLTRQQRLTSHLEGEALAYLGKNS